MRFFEIGAICFICLLLGGGVLLAYSATSKFGEPEKPVFREGQQVEMVTFGNEGMITGVSCHQSYKGKKFPCTYSVRFAAIQSRTNTKFLGRDGNIDVAPIAEVSGIKAYELRLIREHKNESKNLSEGIKLDKEIDKELMRILEVQK